MKISIIVPVYNRGYCLRQCLDSILNQSFTDWECILIDDGSTDNSFAICQEYVANDLRFRAYHQENGGVSAARNKGLDLANGTYINFVDSDDFVENDHLMLLFEAIDGADLSVGGLAFYQDTVQTKSVLPAILSLVIEPANESLLFDIMSTNLLYGPVCKLYLRDLIERNRIRFPKEVSYGEDVIFNFTYLLEVDRIKFVQKALYNVFSSGDSLVSHPENQSVESHLLRYELIRAFFERKKFTDDIARNELCGHYCSVIWLAFYVVVFKHSVLSVKARYCYIRDLGLRLDLDLVNGAVNFTAWKRFFMKHYLWYWFLSEIKYLIRKIKKERV